ncbi:MAG: hypothetical protein HY785_08485 [Oscillatoriophycideae cyanobacterium NC_groundwater_1537_Pr4_S-0.65um_50_18]|nr:hypothetical protein [Oscillatoriophycideae cyanobacterium NC_groundwater_1537_Pr4_S-0.65um_50_18]
MRQAWRSLGITLGMLLAIPGGAIAQSPSPTPPLSPSPPPEASPPTAEQLNLSPEMLENSPVLQRWLQEIPDVRSDIRNDPAFRTRLRLGYSQFSSGDASGMNVGVEDVFVGRSGVTASADYQADFQGNQEAFGAEARYYLLPLGESVNVAPTVGYRHVESDRDSVDGVSVGVRLMLSLSRTGAADASLSQRFVAPGTSEEVGITSLSLGYALTHDLRLSTDLQQQNAPHSKEHRVGVSLEWML